MTVQCSKSEYHLARIRDDAVTFRRVDTAVGDPRPMSSSTFGEHREVS